MSRVAARDWAKDKIRVNVICPGAASEALVGYFEAFPEKLPEYTQNLALGHFADPYGEIGRLAVFLTSDDYYRTGQTLHCDGGQIMQS